MIDRAIGWAGLALAIISPAVQVMFPNFPRWVAKTGLVVGLLLLFVAVVTAFLPNGGAQEPIINQGPGSAYSAGQQGGITVGTVNIGKTPRRLQEAQKQTITAALQGKNIQFDLVYTIDPETLVYATDFAQAFRAAHVQFGTLSFGQIIGAYGISLYDPKGDAVDLATALHQANINFTIASSRSGVTPYPPSTPALTITPSGQ